MSDFKVEVVRIGEVKRHPNADTLSITNVGAYCVIFKNGQFNPGDLAVYVPEECVVPADDPRWEFLAGKTRIRAKRLRGIFSCGLLTPIEPGMVEGQEVHEQLRITKYLTEQERNEAGIATGEPNKVKTPKQCPSFLPRYTDIENLRRHPNVFNSDNYVIVTEKLEGESVAFAYVELSAWARFKRWLGFKVPGPVICRSRNEIKTSGKWFELIDKYKLASKFEKLDNPEDYSIYGESYGYTKGFDYGTDKTGSFAVFDIWDRVENRWLGYYEQERICNIMGLPRVKCLYEGRFYYDQIAKLAEEDSGYGKHMREGVIVRPEFETTIPHFGRLIAKYKSERYLLRNA